MHEVEAVRLRPVDLEHGVGEASYFPDGIVRFVKQRDLRLEGVAEKARDAQGHVHARVIELGERFGALKDRIWQHIKHAERR